MSSPVDKNDYLEQAHAQFKKIPLEDSHDKQAYAKAQEHLKALENIDIDEETWLNHQAEFEKQLIKITAVQR